MKKIKHKGYTDSFGHEATQLYSHKENGKLLQLCSKCWDRVLEGKPLPTNEQ